MKTLSEKLELYDFPNWAKEAKALEQSHAKILECLKEVVSIYGCEYLLKSIIEEAERIK